MYLPVFSAVLVICKKVSKDFKEKIVDYGLEYQEFTGFGERDWEDIHGWRKSVFGGTVSDLV